MMVCPPVACPRKLFTVRPGNDPGHRGTGTAVLQASFRMGPPAGFRRLQFCFKHRIRAMKDRRSSNRRKFPNPVHYSDSRDNYRGVIRDISTGGLFITTQDPLNVGTRIALCFDLPKCRTLLEARIVRSEGQGMGVSFQNIKGENSSLLSEA